MGECLFMSGFARSLVGLDEIDRWHRPLNPQLRRKSGLDARCYRLSRRFDLSLPLTDLDVSRTMYILAHLIWIGLRLIAPKEVRGT